MIRVMLNLMMDPCSNAYSTLGAVALGWKGQYCNRTRGHLKICMTYMTWVVCLVIQKPAISKSASDKGIRSTSTIGVKKPRPSQSLSGPSLFEMLKKQSKELEQDLKKSTTSPITKKWASNTEAFSMFATKKSVIPFRRKL